jgi:hypothetical protein
VVQIERADADQALSLMVPCVWISMSVKDSLTFVDPLPPALILKEVMSVDVNLP